jgi:hypothetical protein
MAFWSGIVCQFTVYAVLLAPAHMVIHRCATGQIFVDGMIRILRRIGLIISFWPVIDLCLGNLANWTAYAAGGLAIYEPLLALDLPVVGVGLLLVAMRMAVALRQDVDLTI